jgi:hypothetical protein
VAAENAGIHSAFLVAAGIGVIAIALAAFLRSPRPGEEPQGHEHEHDPAVEQIS